VLLLRLQVIAACYALSLDLRLQVLWSAKSAIIPGGYNVDAMCRCVEGGLCVFCWGGGKGGCALVRGRQKGFIERRGVFLCDGSTLLS
jgi:hypothetical protein